MNAYLRDESNFRTDKDRRLAFDDETNSHAVEMRRVDRAKVHHEKYFHLLEKIVLLNPMEITYHGRQ